MTIVECEMSFNLNWSCVWLNTYMDGLNLRNDFWINLSARLHYLILIKKFK